MSLLIQQKQLNENNIINFINDVKNKPVDKKNYNKIFEYIRTVQGSMDKYTLYSNVIDSLEDQNPSKKIVVITYLLDALNNTSVDFVTNSQQNLDVYWFGSLLNDCAVNSQGNLIVLKKIISVFRNKVAPDSLENCSDAQRSAKRVFTSVVTAADKKGKLEFIQSAAISFRKDYEIKNDAKQATKEALNCSIL